MLFTALGVAGCLSFGDPPEPLPEYIPARTAAGTGELRVEIQTPERHTVVPDTESSIEVIGGASVFGGVRHIELMLVIDTSKSLRWTDPKDFRAAGAAGLIESLPGKSDIRVGLVAFDSKAQLVSPLETQASRDRCECIPITSPVSGRILQIADRSERVVREADVLMRIGDPGDLEIVVDYLSMDAVSIEAGQRVKIAVEEPYSGASGR